VLAVNLCNQECKNCEELVAVGDTSFVKYNDKDPEDTKVYVEQYSFIHVRAVLNLLADFSRFHALIREYYTMHNM
jgi:hypothetical protein